MNPILAREVRARWRDDRSFILIFALTGLLCCALLLVYQNSLTAPVNFTGSPFSYGMVRDTPWAQAARVSRALFEVITLGNAIGCLILAPAIAAPGLAHERESGLLESLWLSQIKPRSIIIGRFWAAFGFLIIAEMAVLPLASVSLLLGSVSPGELVLSFAIAMTAGYTGTAVALWASSKAYRPMGALMTAYGTIVGWGLLLYYVNGNYVPHSVIFFCLHPITAAYSLVKPDLAAQLIFGFRGSGANLNDAGIWWGLALQNLVACCLLIRATINAARPLPPPAWMSAKNPRVEKWRKNLQARRNAAAAQRSSQVSHAVEGALLAEIPLARFVRFKNPLLQREVRARFRLRQVSKPLQFLRFAVFIAAIAFWLGVLCCALWPETRNDAAKNLGFGLMYGAVALIAVFSAQSFTREREGGTWEGMRLSLLRTYEVIWAKWTAPLITCFYCLSPLLLLSPLCTDIMRSGVGGEDGLPLPQMAGAILFTASWCAFTCALGLLFSWRCRTTATATGLTLGTVAVLVFGTSLLINSLLTQDLVRGIMAWFWYVNPNPEFGTPRDSSLGLHWANPLAILGALVQRNRRNPYGYYYDTYQLNPFDGLDTHLFFVWLATGLCLFYVWRRIESEHKESAAKSLTSRVQDLLETARI